MLNEDPLAKEQTVPWFPRKIQDLDKIGASDSGTIFQKELGTNWPGYGDEEYEKRREYYKEKAANFKMGDVYPRVEYTSEELSTWKSLYQKVTKLYPTHACQEFNAVFPQIVKECGYREDCIPQWDTVSEFVKARTGFTFKPVAGLVSPRDFLSSLAFRVFQCTQYVRHPSSPFYTPEPDVCHELLGHAPMFADEEFANFSQQIGLASLGVEEEYITQLASLYWFTVEFGLCLEDGKRKVFGAGILSSVHELGRCLTEEAVTVPFDPDKAAVTPYPMYKVQDQYFVSSSIRDTTERIMSFAATIPRPFTARYNPYTQSIEILGTKEKLLKLTNDIRQDLFTLTAAINRMPAAFV